MRDERIDILDRSYEELVEIKLVGDGREKIERTT